VPLVPPGPSPYIIKGGASPEICKGGRSERGGPKEHRERTPLFVLYKKGAEKKLPEEGRISKREPRSRKNNEEGTQLPPLRGWK